MIVTTVILASNWYQELVQKIPDGQLFSWRSVFDGLPRIIEKLPTTLLLTLGGAFFWLDFGSHFCYCQNQPCESFVSFAGFFR